MDFGVPREVRPGEQRVGLTASGADALVRAGHRVLVERDAGAAAGFGDEEYAQAGATVVYSAEEVWRRAAVVVKVGRPTAEEHAFFAGQTLLAFLHLSVASPDLRNALAAGGVTAIAAEMIQAEDGTFPVLQPTSEVAGRLAPVIAGALLETRPAGMPRGEQAGRGILLGGIPGAPPANVVILGAGVVGTNAAQAFLGAGAQVTILDRDLSRLRHVEATCRGRIVTMLATPYNVAKAVAFADVLIGAVYVAGQRAPVLVTREMVRAMRPRAVIIDFSIDQGGCVETSRPTTHRDPVFVAEGVIHYCVPNVPARVARTASYAWTNAVLPYLQLMGELGVQEALRRSRELQAGVVVRP
ncbi:MAG: alanine dehydrogenase [Armatimonadota bacterium]|nr:alanine dehydrogenase [Armatimonadota bacterium]MDR7451557.1 alanine dehydrogenase [Armatimonadota bacterium]MDR7467524.1 alanine dehydrogenase [Armatimonadota bacterium]MDR7494398.1 alanine dehydrogenase [Armatimonadota bacterium]MDR7499215.1 alanine dehydrogenase [Armatimonadota bacterium]